MWSRNSYAHFQRVQKIISVLVQYGFYNQLQQIGLLKHMKIYPVPKSRKGTKENLSRGQRVRMALEDLGPTFIKLGQILSTRRDLLPKDVIEELEKLQDCVAPLTFQEVKEQVERELEGNLQDVFMFFEESPLASASIAQVHMAQLKSGQRVVVKVQRPQIEKIISSDIGILEEIASFLDHRTKYGKLYDFTTLAKDFKRSIYGELDFQVEEKNIDIFREQFKSNPDIFFPYTYKEYTTKRVLTMEYIQGISLRQLEELHKENLDREVIAKRLSNTILEQILKNGFFHGDPHPGNIKVLPENRIAFLDMGIVGQLGEERRRQFFKMLAGITLNNSKLIVQAMNQIGCPGEKVNPKQLESAIDELRNRYLEVALGEIKIGEVLGEIFQLAFQYHITIPNEFAMIAKVLITLEGIISKLDPQLNMMEIAKPITQRLMFEMYSPKQVGKRIGKNILDYGNLFMELPNSLLNILSVLEGQDIQLSLQLKDQEKIIKSFNKTANQLSFSIALLALSIVISAFIIAMALQGKPFELLGSMFVKVGLIASIFMGLWLLISIIRTGRF